MTLFDEEGLTRSRILWNLYQKSNHAHAAINWWITHPINILEWHINTVSHHSKHLPANSNTLKVILDMIAQGTVSV